jgi:multidrug resistance efflux pump
MELILLLIYSFFVWLIFFKFKWLPWNIVSQVIVITLPVIGMAVLILFLNLVAPTTNDVRVANYVVQIGSRVSGRVIEMPVEPNRPIKKGAVLFRIDPTQYKNEAAAATAQLVVARAKLSEAVAQLSNASAGARELQENLKAASGQVGAVSAKIELARKRLDQNRELVATGAGSKFDLERAETDLKELQAQLDSVRASEGQVVQKLSAQVGGDQAQVAAARAQVASANAQIANAEAQLADANWKLSETTVYAPADGYAINLQLRVGSSVGSFAGFFAMTFVENEQWILALYTQNELRNVEPGNEAEIALRTYPNRVIKCKVDSIVWATGVGQMPFGGTLAQPGQPPMLNKYAVKLMLDEKEKDLFLAAGAVGNGAIYTDSGHMIHIIRKVIIRVGTKLDWLILKLH